MTNQTKHYPYPSSDTGHHPGTGRLIVGLVLVIILCWLLLAWLGQQV